MNIYLAKIKYNKSHYMGKIEDDVIVYHLVKAETIDEAYDKARKFYESKTVEYSTYYTVDYVEICHTIE